MPGTEIFVSNMTYEADYSKIFSAKPPATTYEITRCVKVGDIKTFSFQFEITVV